MFFRPALMAFVAAGLFLPAAAAETRCGRAGKPWVSVSFAPGAWPSGLRESVLGDLRAGLLRHDVDACPEGGGPEHPWLASARIAWLAEPRVLVSVEIKDKLTEKRVSRDVDLTGVPPDGRAFAVAIATDELVWASWVELALEPEKERAAPPEVASGVAAELPRPDRGRLGARGTFEHFGGGETQLGADALLLLPLAGRLRVEAALGARRGTETQAPHGTVSSSALGLGAALRFALFQANGVELSAIAGLRAFWLRFEGDAEPPAIDRDLSGLLLTARGGLTGGLRLGGGLWVELGATAGAVASGLEASDAGGMVSATSGVELGATLGVGGEL